jgi:D-alanyl-D-alanine carboxypeptidase/D-alanyl-D-alanine-endopeptidase (penicillin-binding protein 4)
MPRRLRVFAAIAGVLLSSLLAVSPPAADASPARASLSAQIAAAFRGSTVPHIDYRIQIANLGTISRNSNRGSKPASNQKLFTAITLLHLVGRHFRYATKVSGTSTIASDGTLHGDLVLVGSGDPTLTIADLHRMARHLHAKGLHHVSGRLIVDDSRYSHVTRVAGWKHRWVPNQSGTVDAFSVDGNEWRGGKAFDNDPSFDNAALWRKELRKAHISIAGATVVAPAPAQLHHLLTHHSLDLAAIVDDTLTNSVNFYAEMMLREAGAQRSGYGSPATGVAAEKSVAAHLGLPLGTVHDGSGLSYADRETPAIIDRWLDKLRTLPIFHTVYYALPLSCDTGTLVGRLCGPNVRGRVRAKTGSINHVAALSGYTTTESGRAVTFSFLLSGFKDRNFTRVLNHLDAAVAVVVRRG